ncbi:hypothetical protein LEMLEM_LOCUS24169 [Lemmus lemmus]
MDRITRIDSLAAQVKVLETQSFLHHKHQTGAKRPVTPGCDQHPAFSSSPLTAR